MQPLKPHDGDIVAPEGRSCQLYASRTYSLQSGIQTSSCFFNSKLLLALILLAFPLKSVAIYSSAGASKRGSELRAYSQDNSFTNSRKVPESYRYRLQGIGKLSNHFRRGLEAYSHSGALAEQAETLADNATPEGAANNWHSHLRSHISLTVPAEQSLDLENSFQAGKFAAQGMASMGPPSETSAVVYTSEDLNSGAQALGRSDETSSAAELVIYTASQYETEALQKKVKSAQYLEIHQNDRDGLKSLDSQLEPDTALSQKSGQKDWPTDECATALQIPKVAMMFLTKGDLYHMGTWKLWFKYAQGYLPIAQAKQACHLFGLLEKAQELCQKKAMGSNGEEILANQHLFNVYVHVGLNNQEFAGFPEDSLFYNTDIKERVYTGWGWYSLVTATRNMMQHALQEPLNRKFILMSEAGIPLYPPTTLYHQLITEEKSRINACNLPEIYKSLMAKATPPGCVLMQHDRYTNRWTEKLVTPQMTLEHWRKSSQWFGLNREHAELIMSDAAINQVFHDHCDGSTEDGWARDCFSDEHYFATLLAVHGRENETDCKGFLMHVDWSEGLEHPLTYHLGDLSAARLKLLRMPSEHCGYQSALETTAHQFVKLESLDSTICKAPVSEYSHSLGSQCPLFARKFAPETAQALTDLLSDCKSGLRIMHDHDCHL